MPWSNAKPNANDLLGEFPSVITTNRIALRQAMERHSFWTDSSTNSIGIPRLSDGSSGPGSFRAFYDVASNASAPSTVAKPLSGRLYLTSDTSHLFALISFVGGPFGTSANLAGGINAVVFQTGSQATIPQGNGVLTQMSAVSIVATSSGTSLSSVTFATAYNAAPTVQVTPVSTDTTTLSFAAVTAINTSGFSVGLRSLNATTFATNLFWRSHGTVAL